MLWLIIISLKLVPHCLANVTVIEDIRLAFHGVTNDMELVNHIIPEMYAASMRLKNPSFVFKMPGAGIGSGSYELLTMQRSDFAEPIFPNITSTSIGSPAIPIESPIPPETSVKTSLATSPPADWQQLGLEGWAGELQPPVPWLEQSHK